MTTLKEVESTTPVTESSSEFCSKVKAFAESLKEEIASSNGKKAVFILAVEDLTKEDSDTAIHSSSVGIIGNPKFICQSLAKQMKDSDVIETIISGSLMYNILG